ncbi:MAG: hypothetical protein M1837_005923 [Sclerophora amabilis]|nr:MAG: hypothetical protein M1837_005923 [Sclerophora amabilis]
MPPKPPLTHFLCLPLVTPSSRAQLSDSLQQLTADIELTNSPALALAQDDEIAPPSLLQGAIRPVGTLHLTLGVMSLTDPDRLEAALTLLLRELDLDRLLCEANAAKPHDANANANPLLSPAPPPPPPRRRRCRPSSGVLLPPPPPPPSSTSAADEKSPSKGNAEASARMSTRRPLTVSLTSLTSMSMPHRPPAPSKTSILYSRPTDPTNRLLPFCQSVRDAFDEAGLIVPDHRPLLLHATVLNTIYAGGGRRRTTTTTTTTTAEQARRGGKGHRHGHGHGRKNRARLTIDATDLIEKYDGFVFAKDVTLEKLAICKMGAKKLRDEHGRVTGEEEYEIVAERPL